MEVPGFPPEISERDKEMKMEMEMEMEVEINYIYQMATWLYLSPEMVIRALHAHKWAGLDIWDMISPAQTWWLVVTESAACPFGPREYHKCTAQGWAG